MATFKEGVEIYDMSPRLLSSLDRIDDVHLKAVGRRAFITAARDGKHKEGSRHYSGAAFDLRTRDLDKSQIIRLRFDLVRALGPDFDVITEVDHIHLELDEK